MDRFSAMELFVRIAETRNFSAVAKERRIGQPTISKQISALEAELGTELLHRNTRPITLTEAGHDYYHSAQRILGDYESTTSRIGRGQIAPRGVVRVAVPPSFARLHMVNKLVSFFERYPGIAVEFGTSESPTSRIEDGFDLAIHSGELPDSSLVARRFAQTLTILVATPQVLARHSLPRSIDELRSLPAIPLIQNGVVQAWEFSTGQRITPSGAFRAGDLEQLRVGVLEHLGIAQAPAWLFAAELREGTVLRLLTKYEKTVAISCVRPASRRPPTRVRALMEHLEASFAVCMQFHPQAAPGS